MSSLLRAGLLAVMVVAGFGFSAHAAAPEVNAGLSVNVSVSVPRVIRIVWGSTTTAVDADNASVAGTVNPAVWAAGEQDFDQTVAMPGVLNIQNAGTARVAISARVVGVTAATTDTGSAVQKWTLADANGTDLYVLSVNTTPLKITATALQAAGVTMKRSDPPLAVALALTTPDDSNFGSTDDGIHAFEVAFTATAP